MKPIICTIFAISLSFGLPPSKSDIHVKAKPDYAGVNPAFQVILSDFKDIALEHDITFTKEVTIGFAHIKQSKLKSFLGARTIGLCHTTDTWREIDIDQKAWKESSYETRISLLFHELAHCYCGRNHDWAKDKPYPEANDRVGRLVEKLKPLMTAGFFEDECPMSLMYPVIPGDSCMTTHGREYLDEIFERCDPY